MVIMLYASNIVAASKPATPNSWFKTYSKNDRIAKNSKKNEW